MNLQTYLLIKTAAEADKAADKPSKPTSSAAKAGYGALGRAATGYGLAAGQLSKAPDTHYGVRGLGAGSRAAAIALAAGGGLGGGTAGTLGGLGLADAIGFDADSDSALARAARYALAAGGGIGGATLGTGAGLIGASALVPGVNSIDAGIAAQKALAGKNLKALVNGDVASAISARGHGRAIAKAKYLEDLAALQGDLARLQREGLGTAGKISEIAGRKAKFKNYMNNPQMGDAWL